MATYNDSSAYKFELFENKKQRTEPQIKVIRNRQAEKAQNQAYMAKVMVYVSVFFIGIISILFNQIAITELTNDVSKKTAELSQLENEYRMLSAELESSVALSNIETVISRDMGMAKLSDDQVTYINLSDGDTKTLLTESSGLFANMWSSIQEGAYTAAK